MWKFLAKASALIFAAAVLALAALSRWRTGHVEWRVVFVFAAAAAAIFAVRAWFPLRLAYRRRFIRFELRRRRERMRVLNAALNELIRSMAGLSPGDLSLYQTILQCAGEGESPCVLTAMGSPNHNVLVQMCDLKLAAPVEAKTVGDPPNGFTSVRYALTLFGQKFLPTLLRDVLRYRAFLSGAAARE